MLYFVPTEFDNKSFNTDSLCCACVAVHRELMVKNKRVEVKKAVSREEITYRKNHMDSNAGPWGPNNMGNNGWGPNGNNFNSESINNNNYIPLLFPSTKEW